MRHPEPGPGRGIEYADGAVRSYPRLRSAAMSLPPPSTCVKRVVTMSGTPAASPTGTLPAWNVLPWDSAYLDVRDYQWNGVAAPVTPAPGSGCREDAGEKRQ